MSKSADAFRTISEVADWLDTPAHVLRFWESKFTQVKPVKRAGGRRYYRPADMRLLGGIKKLLHEDGMTIKGVQKILREQGIKHVASLCALGLGDEDEEYTEVTLEDVPASEPVDTVVPFSKPTETADLPPADPVPMTEEPAAIPDALAATLDEPPLEAALEDTAAAEPEEDVAGANLQEDAAQIAEPDAASEADDAAADTASLPGFLQHSMDDRIEDTSEATDAVEDSTDLDAVAAPEPAPVAATPDPPLATDAPAPVAPSPALLSHIARIKHLSPEQAQEIAPLVAKLRSLAG